MPKKAENQPKPTLLERLSTLTRALTARNSLSQQQCRTLGEVAEALARAEAAGRERDVLALRVEVSRENLSECMTELREAREETARLTAERGAVLEWQHLKTGGVYTEVGRAELQASDLISEGHRLVIYRGQDGRLWARPVAEFLDGRFVASAPAQAGQEMDAAGRGE